MQQVCHEIMDPFDVETPLGYGVAVFLFMGSINSNPSFMVKYYNTGELRVVDMRDVKVYGNPSAGEKLSPSKDKKQSPIETFEDGSKGFYDESGTEWYCRPNGATFYKVSAGALNTLRTSQETPF